ncbi:MAG: hypothetical protein ACOYOK_15340 [Pseudobdellovibrionaceae bacterium]
MGINQIRLNPELSALLKTYIGSKAKSLADENKIGLGAATQIIEDTIQLDEEIDLRDLKKRWKSGDPQDDDFYFEPDAFDVMNTIGGDAFLSLYTQSDFNLLADFKTYQLLSQATVPILNTNQWLEVIGQLRDFYSKSKVKLSDDGFSDLSHHSISFLLLSAPKSILADTTEFLAIEAELFGHTKNDILSSFRNEEIDDPDFMETIPAYRGRIHNLFTAAFDYISANHAKMKMSEFAQEIGKIIAKYLKPEDLKEIGRIEYECIGLLYGDNEEDNDDFTIPLCLTNFLNLCSSVAFELEHRAFQKVQATFLKNLEMTAMNYPLVKIDFWTEAKKSPAELTAKLSSFKNTIAKSLSYTDQFCSIVLSEYKKNSKTEISLLVPASLVEEINAAVEKIIAAEIKKPKSMSPARPSGDKTIQVGSSDFFLSSDFKMLHWKDQVWKFNDNQAICIRLAYEAFQAGRPSVSSELLLDQVSYSTERDTNFRISSDVWGTHEIWQGFFISHPERKGFYCLNPKWNPLKPKEIKNLKKRTPKDEL